MNNRHSPANSNRGHYHAADKRPRPAIPLLTADRAIADGISPSRLRWVAQHNRNTARTLMSKGITKAATRLEQQAAHLSALAGKLELLGYRDAA